MGGFITKNPNCRTQSSGEIIDFLVIESVDCKKSDSKGYGGYSVVPKVGQKRKIASPKYLIFWYLGTYDRGLERIRTAVYGFADRRLAARPRDLVSGQQKYKTKTKDQRPMTKISCMTEEWSLA